MLPRDHLICALEADLVGPFQPDAAGGAEEILPIPPSRWYLTGFLAPQEGRDPQDPTSEEGLGAGLDDESEESASQDPEPKQKNRLPASLGLSVLLGPDAQSVTATVSFAEYLAESRIFEGEAGECPKQVWRRCPRPPATVELPLDERQLAHGLGTSRRPRKKSPNPPFLKGGFGRHRAGGSTPDLAPPPLRKEGAGGRIPPEDMPAAELRTRKGPTPWLTSPSSWYSLLWRRSRIVLAAASLA